MSLLRNIGADVHSHHCRMCIEQPSPPSKVNLQPSSSLLSHDLAQGSTTPAATDNRRSSSPLAFKSCWDDTVVNEPDVPPPLSRSSLCGSSFIVACAIMDDGCSLSFLSTAPSRGHGSSLPLHFCSTAASSLSRRLCDFPTFPTACAIKLLQQP
ncbi:sigma-70 family RNA polymerase sigma factor [Sesbania bispinosa]|nr:sigma-70 family RNA polymerase sigma factor [Sesbania bispinosa]